LYTYIEFDDEDGIIPGLSLPAEGDSFSGAVELPSFKDVVGKKQKQGAFFTRNNQENEEEVDDDDENERNVIKIDRTDLSSFQKLLEVEPNADMDMSYFQNDDEYGTVSVLLSEGAKPFLGIPSGPLQVGHFIGALGIILMAFVEYPGFPLTNLPTALRGALQGGLGIIYLINIVLTIFALFQANERGQPKVLWALKTFTVGGLAYDQLTQLPTLKQLEKKGKRGLKKKK